MANLELSEEGVLRALTVALKQEVERVIAEEATAAAERCRTRVREEVGRIATGLLEHYRLYLQGRDELHIVVKIEHGGQG